MVKRRIGGLEKIARKADGMINSASEAGKAAVGEARIVGKDITERMDKEAKSLQERGKSTIDGGVTQAKGLRSSTSDQITAIEQIYKLKEMGAITQEEYDEQKKKILDRI